MLQSTNKTAQDAFAWSWQVKKITGIKTIKVDPSILSYKMSPDSELDFLSPHQIAVKDCMVKHGVQFG